MASNPKDAPQHYYSLDEYFALEHAGDARYEYWDGEIVCMSGGSKEHAQICSNVHYRLRQKLEGGPCRAFTSEQPIKTPTLLPYRYPDVVVGCNDLNFESMRRIDALINPVLIVEVTSPSSELRDRENKFKAYQAMPGFQEYLLITQDAPRVTHYVRQPDGQWTSEDITDVSASVVLERVGCTLSMQEIYEDVRFAGV